MSVEHVCREGNDPRRGGRCVVCGMTVPGPPPSMRDEGLEHELLTFAMDVCASAYSECSAGYAQRVKDRLKMGAEQYGDNDFMQKDNLIEARQEPLDVGSYLALDLTRWRSRLSPPDWEELRMVYARVIASAVHLDALLEDAHARREELLA